MKLIFENINSFTIKNYPLLASSTDKDGYIIGIYDYVDKQFDGYYPGARNYANYPLKRNGTMLITDPNGESVVGGYWMDFPEREWKIKNPKQWFSIPRNQRAQMEADWQLYHYKPLKEQFQWFLQRTKNE